MPKIKRTSHQQQFLSWCERHNFYTSHSEYDSNKDYTGCVFAVPNGGLRKAIDMVMLKREGLLTGASDVVIMLPKKVVFMEFKTDSGTQSQKQKDFQAVCGVLGLEYYLVWSSFEAVSLVKRWDVLERNKIYLGDCHILLKQIDYADLIIADPPYKIDNTQAGGNSEFSKSIQNMNNEIKELGITKDLGIEWCREIPRLQKKINCYIWCNKAQIIQYLDYFVKELGCSYDIIIWHKINAMPTYNNKYLTDKEYCLYFRKGGYCNPQNYYDAQTVWELPINIKDKKLYGHPTIKPSEMISAFIRNSSKEGDLVVDPFGGSGTTGEQAYLLKRNYLLFEKSEKYYNISSDRLKQAMGKVIIKKVDNQMCLPLDS